MSSEGKDVSGKLVTKRVGKVIKKGTDVINPIEVIKDITEAYYSYKEISESEKTKRQQIKSWERVNVDRIRAQREILMRYLDQSFDERKENFKRLFNILDQCIEQGNTESLALTLKSVIDLARSSPFKDLESGANVRALLQDPDREFEF